VSVLKTTTKHTAITLTHYFISCVSYCKVRRSVAVSYVLSKKKIMLISLSCICVARMQQSYVHSRIFYKRVEEIEFVILRAYVPLKNYVYF